MNKHERIVLFFTTELDRFSVTVRIFIGSKGACISGGFALGLSVGKVHEDSDIDVFEYPTESIKRNGDSHVKSIIDMFMNWDYKIDEEQMQFLAYPYRMLSFCKMVDGRKKVVQWIFHPPNSVDHPMNGFDITVCCSTLEFPDGILHPTIRSIYPVDVACKYVRINPLSLVGKNVATNQSKKKTAIRVMKYLSRGYICDPSSPLSLDVFVELFSHCDEEDFLSNVSGCDICTTPPQSTELPDTPDRPTEKKRVYKNDK